MHPRPVRRLKYPVHSVMDDDDDYRIGRLIEFEELITFISGTPSLLEFVYASGSPKLVCSRALSTSVYHPRHSMFQLCPISHLFMQLDTLVPAS